MGVGPYLQCTRSRIFGLHTLGLLSKHATHFSQPRFLLLLYVSLCNQSIDVLFLDALSHTVITPDRFSAQSKYVRILPSNIAGMTIFLFEVWIGD